MIQKRAQLTENNSRRILSRERERGTGKALSGEERDKDRYTEARRKSSNFQRWQEKRSPPLRYTGTGGCLESLLYLKPGAPPGQRCWCCSFCERGLHPFWASLNSERLHVVHPALYCVCVRSAWTKAFGGWATVEDAEWNIDQLLCHSSFVFRLLPHLNPAFKERSRAIKRVTVVVEVNMFRAGLALYL